MLQVAAPAPEATPAGTIGAVARLNREGSTAELASCISLCRAFTQQPEQMRTSGEAEAVREDDEPAGDAVRDTAPPAGGRQATPPRPYPIWIKVEAGKRRLPPMPDSVSRATWARLSRQVVRSLKRRLGGSVSLRDAVRAVRSEMLVGGASPEDVALALGIAVREHPELNTLDRVNVVTRRLASEELLEDMLGLLD